MDQIQKERQTYNYKGLSNIGATCYMNSLLQALYMTPQFREAIYEWKYNEKIHPKPQDSILYQMQKLFGKLDRKFPGQITTRDLVKSFQWQDEEAQMQQDIQQFNRVLFEALQKSLRGKKNKEKQQQPATHFLRDLYQGEMIHYTHCRQCEHQSQKQQIFQDLLLTVKNPYQKIYNNCVELGLQRYMKPQILDQNNLYSCETCQKKVPAERGVRFLKMPKLLNIILRRFDFDFYTQQRIKVNDRVEFPYVLNMNNYMQGYQNIQNKLNQDTASYFLNKQVPSKNFQNSVFKSSTVTHKKVVTKKSGTPNVAGKITTKPSANTKSFLAQMRKKRGNMQENDDLLFVSGNSQIHNQSPVSAPPQSTKTEQKKQNKADVSHKQQFQTKDNLAKIEEKAEETNIGKKQNGVQKNLVPSPPPLLDLPTPELSKPYITPQSTSQGKQLSMQQQLKQKLAHKNKLQQQKLQKLEELQKKNAELVQQYLKQGPLVYQLYAVMVHNGSANAGHYFSYIKSWENGHWYCFNDERVSQINVEEIEKTYGGIGHSNAYAFYYRQAGTNHTLNNGSQLSQQVSEKKIIAIPSYIECKIQQQIASLRRRQKQKIQNLQNVLVLKIYYQLLVKMLQVNKSSSLELCLLKARQMFDISESIPIHNTRLRMFNPVSQTKLDTYTGRQSQSLQDLKILSYKSMLLEIKKDNQQFQEYVIGKMNLRIVLWEQSKDKIKSLDENFLNLHKIAVTRGATINEVQKIINQKRKQVLKLTQQNLGNICIVKRHQNDEYSYHEVINAADYKEKTLDELMVNQNQILFIEPHSETLMWPIQFQNQIYRITIKYVNGETGKTQNYLTDSRKTVGQLKKQLCQILGMEEFDTIIRRGNKSGMELKTLAATMKDTRFISGTQVYLEKGLPAKPGEVRIQLYIATDAPDDCYNRLHQFQFVADVPISGQWKASEVKALFCTVLKKYKNIELQLNQFRIREKVCDKIGKIYKQRPMKQQQLIEKRQIAIEMKPQNTDGKDFLIYIRIWDPEAWTLSKKLQVSVSKTTTMKDLAEIIYKLSQDVPIEDMEICRILSLNKFGILDLCEMEYFQIADTSVVGQPLFVNADGLMFIVKSSKKQPRNLTKEEQAKFGGNIKPSAKTIKGRNPTRPTKKQKGVSIKVVQNNEVVEQEQKNQAQKIQQNNK